MAKRAALRKGVKWGGLVVSVLLAVAWVGSCWYEAWWVTPGDGLIGVTGGSLALREPLWPLGLGGDGGFEFEPEFSSMHWWFQWGHWLGKQYVSMPLWIPLLIVSGVTSAAWRADARARRLARVNACPACGYDRLGLDVGKVCPECGAAGAIGHIVNSRDA
ncbi:MAG TPA: hypothetical protein VK157_07675 [Phycisphaerales bacterium]|nr:hypothetical protein [Phycisphaerales bacterium]